MPGALKPLSPLAATLLTAVVLGCTAIPESELQPGQRPALETTEAGLWMHMDKMEDNLRKSGRVLRDPELDNFLKILTCRLEPEYCQSVRIYVVDVPYFNASMAPNGMMQVWTGFLLRAENESQVAFVLAHELAHYIQRHSLQRWIDIKNKLNASQILSVLTSAAGVGYVGTMADLGMLASVLAFSREQEREADDRGSERAAQAGFDVGEAAALWKALLAERAASDKTEPWIYFSTHPGIEERIASLEAKSQAGKRLAAGAPGDDGFQLVVAPHLDEWLGDELTRGAYAESEVLFRRLLEAGRNRGLLHFYLGELYRKRRDHGDMDLAIAEYRLALAEQACPPRAHRNLAQALIRTGQPIEALKSLQRYLEANPEAPDRKIVEQQLKELR